jgi:hypothetical protein
MKNHSQNNNRGSRIEIVPANYPVEPSLLKCFIGDTLGAMALISGGIIRVNGQIRVGEFNMNDKEHWKEIVSKAMGNPLIAVLTI